MKFGVVIEPNSACFSLLLGDYSFFSFGVKNALVSRFVSPFKCTVDKKLLTLITPYSKVLRN